MVTRNRGQKSSRRPSRSGTGNNPPPNKAKDDDKGDDPDDEEDPDDPDDPDDDDDDEILELTQKELDGIVQKRAGKASRAAVRAAFKELGFDSIDDLKTALQKATAEPKPKKKSDDDDDEANEVDEAAIRAEAKKDAERVIAERDLSDKIKEAIVDTYGVSMKQASKLRSLVDLGTDAADDDIQDAVDELEEEFPNMFSRGEEEDDPDDSRNPASGKRNRRRDSDRRERPSSNPGRGPRKRRGSGVSAQEAARTLLHQRHPQTNKK